MIFYADSFMYLLYHSSCHHCERLCNKTHLPFPEARKSFFLRCPSFRAAFNWGLAWWFAFQTWGTIAKPSGINNGQCEMTISRAVPSEHRPINAINSSKTTFLMHVSSEVFFPAGNFLKQGFYLGFTPCWGYRVTQLQGRYSLAWSAKVES